MPMRSTSSFGLAAQPGRVDHVQRHAFDLDGLADPVAGGARDRRDDGQLGAGQRVEQRALADVGLAGQHHADALAQQRALLCAVEQRIQRTGNGLQPGTGTGLLQKVDVLLGKVQRRLDQHAQLHDALAQGLHLLRERAAERAAGRARRRFGAGVDQVGHRLGLGQVELAVEERALGELAGLGEAQAHRRAGLHAARQQHLQQHRPAMGLQLEHVLAGVGMRRRKVKRQAAVDGAAVCRQQRQQRGLARHQHAPAQGLHQRLQSSPGRPHDADRPASRRGGDGDDGQGAARQHARIVASGESRARCRQCSGP